MRSTLAHGLTAMASAVALLSAAALAPTASAAEDDAYLDVLQAIPGLTHYYPLTAEYGARDLVGGADGRVVGDVRFTERGAVFDGRSHIELPDRDGMSVQPSGGLTVLVDATIDWDGAGASEYVHWMGKGQSGAHEWAFRHYVDGGSGEARQRQGRVSFYHWNPSGGLGAGSYVQEGEPTDSHQYAGTVDTRQVQLFKDGTRRDADSLSGYDITPRNTSTPVRLGTRDGGSGYLVGTLRRVVFYDRVLTSDEVARIYAARDLPDSPPVVEEPEPPVTEPDPEPEPEPEPAVVGDLNTWTGSPTPGTDYVIRRAAGSTPPAGPTDGDFVAVVTPEV